ncbi:MAG: excinuclease ABC subunit UvrA, partial [Chlamydiia bacterium]|nr:excinuclease ABC subunit UvrA [Chlamydiia bacterium]
VHILFLLSTAICGYVGARSISSANHIVTARMSLKSIRVVGAREHNLKNVTLEVPRDALVVMTGLSGSGKSSLAFDTIYAEGQRRYVDSLSPYARTFVKQMPKPKVDHIEGLSPAIAIEQKHHAGNPRSTVGTMTEIYDYLRILYTYLGIAYCPETGDEIKAISKDYVVEKLLKLPTNTKLQILAPIPVKAGTDFQALCDKLQKQGFLRVRFNGAFYELGDQIPYESGRKCTLELVVDRLIIKSTVKGRLYEAVSTATAIAGGQLTAATPDQDHFFNLAFAVEKTGRSYPPITPHTFSFNTEAGACPDCTGLGFQWGANLEEFPELLDLTPIELIADIWGSELTRSGLALLRELLKQQNIDPKAPLSHLSSEALHFFFLCSEKTLEHDGLAVSWQGLNITLAKAAKAAHSNIKRYLTPLMKQTECLSCKGARLSALARGVRIGKTSLPELCAMPLSEAKTFIQKLKTTKILSETHAQLLGRMQFLIDIGLHYLSLHRSAPTLSGGEAQRIQLARQLGSGLTGCLYVLDEPTIGLHPHNNHLLNDALIRLKNLGNTLLLVEHDPLTMQIADRIYDFGPKAGRLGGKLTFAGTLSQIKKSDSLTGAYLSGKKNIPVPKKRRPIQDTFPICNAKTHNLKNISLDIPKNLFVCLTGLSGSGKSTLMHDVIATKAPEHFDKIIALTQSPIGHTIRADMATYSDLLTPLRHFFASLPAAKAKGLMPRHFSYNTKQGMCSTCWGLGFKSIDLQFLPPVRSLCPSCNGYKLKPLTLDITYKGKHLGHILNLTIDEAIEFLPPIPKLQRLVETLQSVGLGYLKFSQEIQTLSGGEAQRLRLARELKARRTPNTLYLFDEPTIGLHTDDIARLLPIFHALVDKGASLIIIEHNLDLIKTADYVIDLGPEAGKGGGHVVAQGTPEDIAKCDTSYTGKYLKELLRK